MLSHIGVRVDGLNPGVIAVVIFYILAGYVVSFLYCDLFVAHPHRIRYFYTDRIKRIFPLYLYVVVLTLLFLLWTSFGNPHYTVVTMVENLLVIPLNYYMYIESTVLQDPPWCLVPPAWSLGAELQAYMLLPLAFAFQRLKWAFAVVTFAIYFLANMAWLPSDYYGYRLLAGVFFIFLLGGAIQKDRKEDRYLIFFLYMATLAVVGAVVRNALPVHTYARETTLGILLGVPLIYLLSKIKVKLPLNALFGALSYALFLTHFLAIWILRYSGVAPSLSVGYIVKLTTLALLMASIGIIIVERKLQKKYKS